MRRRPWSLAILCLSVAACDQPSSPPAPAAPATPLHGSLEHGPFEVGFSKERIQLAPKSGAPSALDLYLWYPAGDTANTEPLTLSDYYTVQEESEPSGAEIESWLFEDMTSPPGVEPGELNTILAARMWAHRNLEPASQRHPLVLWSYRGGIPTMQSVLTEYLASHGYVVAFSWPVDNAPPLPWQGDSTAEERARSLDLQIDLLESALDSLAERGGVSADRTAVLAWSYGGESATGLQMRRQEIRLVLGIDATLVSGGVFQTAEELESIDRSSLNVPYALLRNGRPRLDAESSPEPPLLAEIPGGSWYLRFPALSHGNFNVPGGMIPGVLGLTEVSEWAVGGEAARLGYESICRHVLGLLEGNEPLTPAPGVPEGFVEVVRHQPHG